MNLIERFIRLPVTVTVGVLLVMIFGAVGLMQLPVQLTPNVDRPVITVTTTWFGASPQEMVREVAEEQEEVLKSVSGLREMSSTNMEGRTELRLEFAVGVDKEAALNEVRDKLRQVPDYPPEVDEPVIEAIDPDDLAFIAWFILRQAEPPGTSGPPREGYNGDIATLGDFLEDEVQPVLERAEGIERIRIFGGRERELQVRVDMQALAARGLTLRQLISRLQDENADITAGTISQGKTETSIRVIGQYDDPDEVMNTVVAYSDDGAPIYVSDVAEVILDFKKEIAFVRSMGEPVIAIAAQREVGANALQAMANLKRQLQEVNELVLKPTNWGLELEQVYDQTIYIWDALYQARNNLLVGAVLAAAVLFVTLRSVGATTVVLVAVPVSVMGTFLGLWLFDRNINVISMAGMTFAVGMGIDNAIVVLENIFRHREMGKDRIRAAVDGTKEVWGAIVAATLTNVVVFLPMVFIQAEAGQLFRDIAVALTISFFFYLFVAPTVIPMLTTWFIRRMPAGLREQQTAEAEQTRLAQLTRPVGRIGTWISAQFYNFVIWMSRGVIRRVALVLGLIVVSAVGSLWLMPPLDYLPPGNQNLIFGVLLPPPGYSRDEFRTMAYQVEGFLRPWWEVGPRPDDSEEVLAEKRQRLAEMQRQWRQAVDQHVIPALEQQIQQIRDAVAAGYMSETEAQGALAYMEGTLMGLRYAPPPPPIENFFFVNFNNMAFMGASTSHENAALTGSLTFLMQSSIQGIPGTMGFFQQEPIFRTDRFGGGLTINVVAPREEQVVQAALLMQGVLKELFEVNAQPQPQNFNIGRPELQIDADRVRAAAARVSTEDIRTAAAVAVDGRVVGDYRYQGRAVDLTVLSSVPRHQMDIEMLRDVPLATLNGQVVPLSQVANFIMTSAPQEIRRIEEQPAVSLNIQLPPGMTIQEADNAVQARVAELQRSGAIPPEVRVLPTGSANKLIEFRDAFIPGFILAAVVTYLLMASLFESFLYPFVIILSVPFATLGGFVGLAILHALVPSVKLDVLTMLGFVILVGTIVNMPILIVHQSLNNLAEGMDRARAIAHATQTRVRPIFMSVTTSVAGMAPLVVFGGAGSELYRGLGAVIVGGLLLSTFLTLFLTPTLLSLMLDLMDVIRRLFGRGPTPRPGGHLDVPHEHTEAERRRHAAPVTARTQIEPA